MITLREWKVSNQEFADFVRIGKQVDVEIVKDLTRQQNPRRRAESDRFVVYLKESGLGISPEGQLRASFVEVNRGVWVFEGYVRADSGSSIVHDDSCIVSLEQAYEELEMLRYEVKEESNNSGELKTITVKGKGEEHVENRI